MLNCHFCGAKTRISGCFPVMLGLWQPGFPTLEISLAKFMARCLGPVGLKSGRFPSKITREAVVEVELLGPMKYPHWWFSHGFPHLEMTFPMGFFHAPRTSSAGDDAPLLRLGAGSGVQCPVAEPTEPTERWDTRVLRGEWGNGISVDICDLYTYVVGFSPIPYQMYQKNDDFIGHFMVFFHVEVTWNNGV